MPLYERFDSDVGGSGLRATRDIPLGTPIISEPELFSKVEGKTVTGPQADLPGFQELSCPVNPATPDARFKVNSFGMGTDRNGNKKEGIFLEPSRLNHSCVPNAYFAWNSSSQQITVHASEHIPKGNEIFVNYFHEAYHKTTAQRKKELSDDYQFNCLCRACQPDTAFGIISQERRRQMHNHERNIDRIKDLNTPNDRKQLRAFIQDYICLLEKEGLVYPQLADMYDKEVKWFCDEIERATSGAEHVRWKVECREDALQAARKKLYWDVACNGHDAPIVKNTLKLIGQLKKIDISVAERHVNLRRSARH